MEENRAKRATGTYLRDLTDMAALISQDLTDLILEDVLPRLTPADLLRAALACQSWGRAAVHAIPRVPPARGYYLHTVGEPPHPAEFRRLTNAPVPDRLSIPLRMSSYVLQDVHLGVILLQPPLWTRFPTIFSFDPASRRESRILMPSIHALPPNEPCTCFLGAAILSRAHPSRLTFDAVCLTAHGQHKRAWIVSVLDGAVTSWLPWPKPMGVVMDFDPMLIERRGVHAAGNIYWHIGRSTRVLQLDPDTLDFSFLTVPDNLDDMFDFADYRIGETPEDGRLCLVSLRDGETLQIWVRGGNPRWSDNGWSLQREFVLTHLFDAIPDLPKEEWLRMRRLNVLDIDPHRTGKVFIYATGCGRYFYDLLTGRMDILTLNGHPVYAYTMPWPPEFLTPPQPDNMVVDHNQ